MQNGMGNLAGIIGPTHIGVTIDATGSYNSAFVLSSALAAMVHHPAGMEG